MSTQRILCAAAVSALLVLSFAGCATTKTTALRVAGTTGAEFTAYYVAGGQSGAITSIAQSDAPVTVMELPGHEFRCDVRKAERAASLSIDVYRGEDRVFRGYVPPGMEGIRIRQVTGKWQGELY
jgi:hypothetical protein